MVLKGDCRNQIAAILRILRKRFNSHIAQRGMSTKTRGKQPHTPAILLAGIEYALRSASCSLPQDVCGIASCKEMNELHVKQA